jgi:hypothetical protein
MKLTRKAAFAMIVAPLMVLGPSARAQVVMYNCGDEVAVRADIANQFVWITSNGIQEIHRARINDTYISWDLRSVSPMRMERKTGLTEHWAVDDQVWKTTGTTCVLQK